QIWRLASRSFQTFSLCPEPGNPVLEVHGRNFRQAETLHERHQWRQTKLPHSQPEVATCFQVDDTSLNDLSCLFVHLRFGQMDIFAIDIEDNAWCTLFDELQQQHLCQMT